MTAREVGRPPVPIEVGVAPWIRAISIDRFLVNPWFNVDTFFPINGGSLVIIVVMFHDLPVDDRRPFVRFFFFGIRTQICSKSRTTEAQQRYR